MKNAKKILSLFIICTMVLSLGAFAKTTTTKAGKTGKLTIWAWDPNFNVPVMNSAAAAYDGTLCSAYDTTI